VKRYRWFKARWPDSIRSVAKRIKSHSFDSERSEGFILDRVRDSFLDARFVELIKFDQTVIDPFGIEETYSRVEYRTCEFRASTEGPGLELVNSPRSVQTMFSRLGEATNFALAVSPISVNTLAWVENIQRRLGTVGIVRTLQVNFVELTPNVVAKVVAKGTGNVLAATNTMLTGKKYVIEKAQIHFSDPYRVNLLLTCDGAARFDVEPTDEVLAVVRSSLSISLR
jgi:hypothetical protein